MSLYTWSLLKDTNQISHWNASTKFAQMLFQLIKHTVPYLWKYATECSDVQNERYVNKVSRRELDSLQSGFRVTEMRWDFTANHICYTDCLEAFYNNNTYNWTTFWPFKTFAITLTYYYSNAITHLNALLLRSIVRVHGTINLTFFPHQLSSSRRIIIYNTAPARQYFRTYNLILMSVGYICREEV